MTPMAVGFQGWHSRGSGTIPGRRHLAVWYASVFFFQELALGRARFEGGISERRSCLLGAVLGTHELQRPVGLTGWNVGQRWARSGARECF